MTPKIPTEIEIADSLHLIRPYAPIHEVVRGLAFQRDQLKSLVEEAYKDGFDDGQFADRTPGERAHDWWLNSFVKKEMEKL